MKRFDSLEAYEELVKAGMPSNEAKTQVRMINHFWQDIASEFLSNRAAAGVIAIVAVVGTFLVAETWKLSVNMEKVIYEMAGIKTQVIELKDLVKK